MVKIMFSNILRAFDPACVGTRVIDREGFLTALKEAVEETEQTDPGFSEAEVPGQGFVVLPKYAHAFVLGGDGLHTHKEADYVAREWQGRVGAYLKRKHSLPVTFLGCPIYTKEAYLEDPDTRSDKEESERVRNADCTHVLVAVIAAGTPEPVIYPMGFLHNLAGGNRAEQEILTKEDIIAKARKVCEQAAKYCVVAD